ncbi:MAG TPA: phosphoenolpyruvate carboxylase, partial [Thermomicrobiales bacterium]|nr:phosphoenolpyruvate carboxylase [Thermomicrobiales bacterium]
MERTTGMTTARTLSDDIYLLAGLLGETLRAQASEAAFEREERARALAKAFRAGEAGAGEALADLVGGLDPGEADSLVRAFTLYFQLINLAEDSERIRRIRRREASEPGWRRGSLGEAIARLAAAGVDAAGLQAMLDRALVRPVLTAHPTEARRRTIIAKLARVFAILRDLDARAPLPREVADARRRLAGTIAELWSSDEIRAVTPTVLDEVRAYLVYVTATLVHVVPQVYRDLEAAIAETYPDAAIGVPPVLTFGTWVGGDRDGNPNVTPAVTAETLEVMRDAALAFWDGRLVELAGRLSLSERVVGPAPALQPWLAAYRERFPEIGQMLA